MRQVTWCVVEEVKSGDWGIAGNASRPSTCARSPRAPSDPAAHPGAGRAPAGTRRGAGRRLPVSLGGMREVLERRSATSAREVVGLTRALIRADTTNPPGNETRGAEVLDAYLRRNGVEAELVARDPAAREPDRARARSGHGPLARAHGPHRRRLRRPRGLERPAVRAARCATATCGAAGRST